MIIWSDIMQRKGVSHPIPTKFAERIYNNKKTVFIGKRTLNKVSRGDKFVIYESQGAKAYTGWADIVEVGTQKTGLIHNKYKNKMILSQDELSNYAKRRVEMNVIEFENFEKFTKPVKPKRFVGIGGKYIYEDEFNMIKSNKG